MVAKTTIDIRNMFSKFNKDLMKEAIERRLVKSVKHPRHDLYLLSYTRDAQYGHVWTNETKAARSLVVDADFNVVSACMPKFFNDFDQAQALKTADDLIVYEKYDGSMVNIFTYGGETIVRTKTVWESDIISKVAEFIGPNHYVPEGVTQVCEWIDPDMRHIVDYRGETKLVLLTVLHNQTSYSLPVEGSLKGWPFDVAETHRFDDTSERTTSFFRDTIATGAEGYVLFSPSMQLRTKIKSAEYLRLHRIKFDLTPKAILEMISTGDLEAFDRMKSALINLDETTADKILSMYHDMTSEINTIHSEIAKVFSQYKHIKSRKDFSQAVLQHGPDIAGGCFILRDKRLDKLDDYVLSRIDLKKYNSRLSKFEMGAIDNETRISI